MKTTRKSLTLVSLTVALMLLMASCNFNLFPAPNNGATTANNPPADTPFDISKIPESQGLLYEAIDDTTCMVYGPDTCRDTVVRVPEVIDGYLVTEMGFAEPAFLGTSSVRPDVTTLIIPKTVTKFHAEYFAYEGLTNIVVDPENPIYYSEGNCIIEKISKKLVAGCDGSVIPKDVTSIGDCAFFCCTNLTSLTIPASVRSIGVLAFYRCTNLTSLTIPASVTSIGECVFDECDKLTNVTVDRNNSTYEITEDNCLVEKATGEVIAVLGACAEHSYTSDCDRICNRCGEHRTTNVEHEFDNIYDGECNLCGELVPVESVEQTGHTFSSACDMYCNRCGAQRATNVQHEQDNIYDPDCNLCGELIPVPVCEHSFSSDCDHLCNVCGRFYRETDVLHQQDDEYDSECNLCGEEVPYAKLPPDDEIIEPD